MMIGRRGFLMAGGAAAGAGVLPVSEAIAAPVAGGRSVTDFGVEPNSDADQTKALQKSIDEISAGNQGVYIPGGSYRVEALTLPPNCAISGDPGLTMLHCRLGATIFAGHQNQSLSLSGVSFDSSASGQTADLKTFLIAVKGGALNVSQCRIRNAAGAAIYAEAASGVIAMSSFSECNYGAVRAQKARGLTISQCRFERCKIAEPGIQTGSVMAGGEGVLISANQLSECTGGILLQGSGVANGNFISRVVGAGLKLGGSGDETGAISATGNTISDCDIGIAVGADGETIFASLNLITRAKSGAIRAFHDNKLVGPDLAHQSAEAFLNLTVAGNVAR